MSSTPATSDPTPSDQPVSAPLTAGEVFRRCFGLLLRAMETGNFFVAAGFLFVVYCIWELPGSEKVDFLLRLAETKAVAASGWVAFAISLYLFRYQLRHREKMHRDDMKELRQQRDEAVRGQLKLPFPPTDN